MNCRLNEECFKSKLEKLKNDLLNPSEDYKSIFFESIDKLNLELQSFVLSFLQEIGKTKNPIKVFCSTESFLENQVQSGQFNKDLYYCISSIILNFLPLRSRKEDILIIANYYKCYFEKKSGIKFDDFSDIVVAAIENAFWCGNVDELINSIQRAFIVGNKSYITKQDLGLESLSSLELVEGMELNVQDKSLKNAIDTFKKEYSEDERKLFAFEVSGALDSVALNERVTEAEVKNGSIVSVTSTNVLTGLKTKYKSKLFADCSGDATLSRLANCETAYGREARSLFNESLAPENSQKLVMGHSIRWYSEKTNKKSK